MLQCVVNSENPAVVSDQRYTSSPLAQTGLVQGRLRALGDLALPLGGRCLTAGGVSYVLLAGCSHAANSTQIITDGAALGLSPAPAAHSPASILFASLCLRVDVSHS